MFDRARSLTCSTILLALALSCTPRPVPLDAGVEEEPADAGPSLAALGERCEANGECESEICVRADSVGAQRVCVSACGEDRDCSAQGEDLICVDDVTDNGVLPVCRKSCDGGCAASEVCVSRSTDDAEIHICEESGPPCTSQNDCDGAPCARVESWPEGFTWHCIDDALEDQAVAGESCAGSSANLECASMRCDSGRCTGPCEEDADCPDEMRCAGEHQYGGMPTSSFLVPQCIAWPGTGTACATDAECSGGEVCAFLPRLDGSVAYACRLPMPDDAAFGELCGDDGVTRDVIEPPRYCAGRLCTWGFGNEFYCSAPCDIDADCGAGWQCLSEDHQQGGLRICVRGEACSVDADCSGGDVCVPEGTAEGFAGRCTEPLGARTVGEECNIAGEQTRCSQDADCALVGTGWRCNLASQTCLPPFEETCTLGTFCSYPGHCIAMCESDADCGPNAWMLCEPNAFAFSNNFNSDPRDDEEAFVNLCINFEGSRALCATNDDCGGAEVCRPYRGLDEQFVLMCATPLEGMSTTGEPCNAMNNDICDNGLCDWNDGDGSDYVGTCGATCADDGDCPSPMTCQDWPSLIDAPTFRACRLPGAVDDFSG